MLSRVFFWCLSVGVPQKFFVMTYWHKMPLGQFLMYEAARKETWPFLFGAA